MRDSCARMAIVLGGAARRIPCSRPWALACFEHPLTSGILSAIICEFLDCALGPEKTRLLREKKISSLARGSVSKHVHAAKILGSCAAGRSHLAGTGAAITMPRSKCCLNFPRLA